MRTRELRHVAVLTLFIALIAIAVTTTPPAANSPPREPSQPTGSAPSGQSSTEDQGTALYNEGLKLADSGDFEKARDTFEKANRVKKNDPDILNMLAFTQRKTGLLDEAFDNYRKALKIQPRFPRAREYLAEAHLQAAMQELETLKGYGTEGEEDARQFIEALRQAAASASNGELAPATGRQSGKGGW